MDLIINSLYSDKDIFLRELVSNAADACDKKRFLGLTEEAAGEQPEIKIKANMEDNTLTIEDSGVGMTKDELMNNLGKIAQSGTRAFADALGDGSADVNLIGQFGVGFYSAYLVADKVTVVTKSMQDSSKAYRWESQADSSYTIADASPDDIAGKSGSKLTLHLKDDCSAYTEATKISELLQRYSEFIEFPISVWKETTEYKQVPDEEANKDLEEGEEPKMKTVPETTEGYEAVNNQKPIWLRNPREVTEDEYQDFYKSAFRNSYDTPLKHIHFILEGQVECKSVLYIPGTLPYDLSRDMFDENSRNIRLYVKRVFINDKFDELLPRWLKFVKGVVDSDDLPLNVSREILQKSKVLSIINKRLVRKSLDMIRDLSESEDGTYASFWNNFGKYLKVGILEDERNRDEVAGYLRFFSVNSDEEYTSLDQYIEKMPEGQKAIYYVTGEGKAKAKMSPVIEKLKSRGFDVLFASEPLDEIMFESLTSYKDVDIKDAGKDTLGLDDDEESKKKKEELSREYVDVINYLETCLSGSVQKVSVSDLLTDSPAALVQGAYGMSPSMQRYMRAQAVAAGSEVGDLDSMNKVVMEINPNHPVVKELDKMVKGDKESDATKDFAMLLFDVAGLTSGYEVNDMSSFAKRVMGLMSSESVAAVPDAEIVDEAKSDDDVEPAVEVEVEAKSDDDEEPESVGAVPDAEIVDEAKSDGDEEPAVEVEVESKSDDGEEPAVEVEVVE
jgi:molecular chaperone HtpG